MRSFPQPGSVTVCEINRNLSTTSRLAVTALNLSDDGAKDAYGKTTCNPSPQFHGMVFSPVPFQWDQLLALSPEHGAEQPPQVTGESVAPRRKDLSTALQRIVNDSLKRFFHPNDGRNIGHISGHSILVSIRLNIYTKMECLDFGVFLLIIMSFRPKSDTQLLQFEYPEDACDSTGMLNALNGILELGVNCLPEVDLQGVSWHRHKHILAFISGPNQVIVRDYEDSEGKEPCILTHESQRDVKLIEGGICMWAASYPGNAAIARSGVAPFFGTVARGSGIRWTVEPRVMLYALLFCCYFIYLIGLGTPIRRGLGGISILKWSPTGDYFLSAKFDGTFYLWETNTWTSEPWSSTSGFVTKTFHEDNKFHGDSSGVIFCSSMGGRCPWWRILDFSWYMVASGPQRPRLANQEANGSNMDPDGHMVLIAFSKSSTLGSVHFASKPPSLDAHLLPVDLPEIMSLTGSQGIEKIAWDATGERLALSYKGGDELYKGLIAIYDVRRNPLISASLMGPGENPKPLAFSFHDKFKQGPLLSVFFAGGFSWISATNRPFWVLVERADGVPE
ncbi:Aladin [Vitis vinifera]|uniref:Aladin n=1 Tax=Vitis vinifera TaxID=29760 RepID=A0A438J7F9_VITVI|nr:Aladin [Vitis vinifera]